MSVRAAAVLPAPPSAPRGNERRERALWWSVSLICLAALAATTTGRGALPVVVAGVVPLVLIAGQRTLLAWPTLFGLILVVILFIPIRRYSVGGGLPIELEPYRLVIAAVLACWLAALAVDSGVRWKATGLEAPVVALLLAMLLSLVMNAERAGDLSGTVIKQGSFFVSFFLVTYFISSVITRGAALDRMLRILVGGGTLVAVAALIEWRTGTNLFNGLGRVIPILNYIDQGDAILRGSGARALASAQHPIALGAALVMLIPLTVYLHRRDRNLLWLGSTSLVTLGALSTGSRTAALMLIVLLLVFLWLKPVEVIRLAPGLLPLLVVIQVVMPGTLGTFKVILNPTYVISEQSAEMGTGTGRIADLGPSLEEWARAPFVGQGFGTRITAQDSVPGTPILESPFGEPGAQILDNQWLGMLLETGLLGVAALLWLFVQAMFRLARRARADSGAESWLATALAASLTAYAVGMLTYDAFSFIQVTFLAFIMLGFAAVVTAGDRRTAPSPAA